MAVQGITWHAAVMESKQFDAMKKMLMGPLGLKPMMEMPGVSVFQMPNGSVIELYLPNAVPPYGYNDSLAYGFRVDDVEKTSADLKKAGIELLGQITRLPEHKYAYRHFRAPDGRVYGLNEQEEQRGA